MTKTLNDRLALAIQVFVILLSFVIRHCQCKLPKVRETRN
jgi:hypothetical protein